MVVAVLTVSIMCIEVALPCSRRGFASKVGEEVSMIPRETPRNGGTTVPGISDVTCEFSPRDSFCLQAPGFSTRAKEAPAVGGDAP